MLWMPCGDWKIPYEMVSFLLLLKKSLPKNILLWVSFVSDSVIHKARNELVKIAIEQWYEYLWFLDDDNIPDKENILEKMLGFNKWIVWAVIRARGWLHQPCVWAIEKDKDGIPRYHQAKDCEIWDELVEVWALWCWCVLITRDVFVDMYTKYHWSWFESKKVEYILCKNWEWVEYTIDNVVKNSSNLFIDELWNYQVSRKILSEDILAWERAKQHWYNIYCDVGSTCTHIGKKYIYVHNKK
jgi:hypothetical protein